MAADTRTYLDTNVYNRIVDVISLPIPVGRFDSLSTSQICLSPINILEILQIKNELRRESIVRVLQELCAPDLLAEPEALLVDFIAEGTRIEGIANLRLDSPFSTGSLGQAWKEVRADSAKTFVFNDQARSSTQQLKLLNHLFHTWYRRGNSLEKGSVRLLGNYRSMAPGEMAAAMLNAVAQMQSMPVADPQPWPFRDLILFLAACVLVVGVTPFPESIDKLWASLGIDAIDDRIGCVLQGPLKIVLSEGPLVGIAAILAYQLDGKFNRGNLLDTYHASYLPYVSDFLTCDEVLLLSARHYSRSPQFAKIQRADAFLHAIVPTFSRT